MRGVAGLRGQVSALPLIAQGCGVARGPLPIKGIVRTKSVPLTATPSDISASQPSSLINSGVVKVQPAATRRGEAWRIRWEQISGPPGTMMEHVSGGVYFQHSLPGLGTYPIVWRYRVENQFGMGGVIDIAFSLTYYDPGPPPLFTSFSPTSQQLVYINPTTRIGRCYFSASGSGGVPPYTYDWGGGALPNSASNYADIYLPPGATQGIDFGPGCTVTDSVGQSKPAGPCGPFFVLEG